MKKGFTLIEMIGVIVIIALMALIVIPPVTRSIKKGEEDADKKTIESVIAAAKNYVSDERPIEDECVSIETLQNEGYLDFDVNLSSSAGVQITREGLSSDKIDYKYSYEYVDSCD